MNSAGFEFAMTRTAVRMLYVKRNRGKVYVSRGGLVADLGLSYI